LGWVGELQGLMETKGEGALTFGPSHSVMFSIGQDFNLADNVSVSSNAHFVFSNLQPISDSLIQGTQGAVSSAFDVALDYRDFSLQLSQPVYFESGVLKVSRPDARRADGAVIFQSDEVSLQSASRPVLLSLTHQSRIGQLGVKVEKNAGLSPQYGFAWEMKF
jgi:hypothetical protein